MRHEHGGNIYERGEILDFSANINPLGMPEDVRQAALSGVEAAVVYPQPYAYSLCKKIAAYESARVLSPSVGRVKSSCLPDGEAAGSLHAGQVFVGNGAADLLFLLTRALQPEEGILFVPTFAEYEAALLASGSKVTNLFLEEESDFAVTSREVGILRRHLSAVAGRGGLVDQSMVFVCQPGNPSGNLIEEKILLEIVEICRKFGAWLVIDACFVPLLEEEQTTRQDRVIAECLQYERTIVLRAFTKAFAMPGLRLGYLICKGDELAGGRLASPETAGDSLASRLRLVSQPWSVSLPAMMAGEAALEETDYLRTSRAYLHQEKERLLQELQDIMETGMKQNDRKPALIQKIYGHAANYIFFRSVPGLQAMLQDKGILIRDCSNYTGLGAGYYRIAVRTREENDRLLQAMRAIAAGHEEACK